MSAKKSLIYNFVGLAAPLFFGAYSIPVLLVKLGMERFGILTIAWAIVGYFSLFDLGLSRALTKLVSERRILKGDGSDAVGDVAVSGVVALTAVGIPFLFGLYIFSDLIAKNIIGVSEALSVEVVLSIKYLALSVPITMLSNGIRGVAEGYQRFDLTNIVRVPQAISNYLLPLVIAIYSQSLDVLVLSLVISRLFFLLVLGGVLLNAYPHLIKGSVSRNDIVSMLRYGGWLSVSSFIAPLMLYADRFFVSAVIGAEFVAYYTTPFEVVTKLWIIPTAILGVVFPMLAQTLLKSKGEAITIYRKSQLLTASMLVPLFFLIFLFSKYMLTMWINANFANSAYQVMTILAFGVLVNSMAQISATYIQASGRPDITAKINAIEIVPYFF